MTDDECFLAEIQENTARNELTAAERKAFAAEVGRLIAKMTEDCQDEDFANGKNDGAGNWVDDLAKKTGTPTRTLFNWWSAFTKATARDITPKKATEEDKQAFFDWLDAQKQKEDEEKARKAEEAEAEKVRKAEEARLKKIEDERSEMMSTVPI